MKCSSAGFTATFTYPPITIIATIALYISGCPMLIIVLVCFTISMLSPFLLVVANAGVGGIGSGHEGGVDRGEAPVRVGSLKESGMAAQETERDHIIIFSFMAKGHPIPLHLTAAVSTRGLCVTLVTTPANSPFINRRLPSCRHSFVDILTLTFPHLYPLPPSVESTDVLHSMDLYPTFPHATSLLRYPFHHLLVRLLGVAACPPLCLISDFFLDWTLPLCHRLGLPHLIFHGMSAISMALCKSLWVHQPHSTSTTSGDHRLPFHAPGTPPSLFLTLTKISDTVDNAANPDDPVTQYLNELGDLDVSNFADIDGDYIWFLESFYRGRACT